MVIQGPKIGRQPVKKMKILKYRTEPIEVVETERFPQNSYLASLLEIGFGAKEKIVSTNLAQDICARLT